VNQRARLVDPVLALAPLLALALILAIAAPGCGPSGDPPPAALDTSSETCRSCRMPVSDPRLAAQLVAPGEEPAFFDDIGCLRDFLGRSANATAKAPGTIAYVADHRTASWQRAARAVYSRCPSLETPMGSHLMAHADAASRDADAASAGCRAVSAEEVFGSRPSDGRKEGG
jgi:copper chaperone NosL